MFTEQGASIGIDPGIELFEYEKVLLTKVMKGVKGVRVGMKVVVEEANDYIG